MMYVDDVKLNVVFNLFIQFVCLFVVFVVSLSVLLIVYIPLVVELLEGVFHFRNVDTA